jgi:nicotinamidase-related amidase
MHNVKIPDEVVARVTARIGRAHPFDVIVPEKTALVVVDMQNYFVKEGFMGEVPPARAIVPAINRLAAATRAAGGHVVWVKNTSTAEMHDTWSVFNNCLMTPDKRDLRTKTQDVGHEGHQLYAALDAKPEDAHIVKRRFSAFIQGSSDIVAHLRARGIDTIMVAGTATNVCCESSARDAMMLNFKTLMISDACATYTDAEHNATLATFYMIFGDVQTVDEAIESMARGQAQAAA